MLILSRNFSFNHDMCSWCLSGKDFWIKSRLDSDDEARVFCRLSLPNVVVLMNRKREKTYANRDAIRLSDCSTLSKRFWWNTTNHKVRSEKRELSARSPNRFALPHLITQNPNIQISWGEITALASHRFQVIESQDGARVKKKLIFVRGVREIKEFIQISYPLKYYFWTFEEMNWIRDAKYHLSWLRRVNENQCVWMTKHLLFPATVKFFRGSTIISHKIVDPRKYLTGLTILYFTSVNTPKSIPDIACSSINFFAIPLNRLFFWQLKEL